MSGSSHQPGASVAAADPLARLRRRRYGAAVLLALLGVAQLVLAGGRIDAQILFNEGLCVIGIALAVWTARRYGRLSGAVARLNGAFVHLVAGREREAEEQLAAMAPAASREPYIRRGIDLQLTLLAMRRGRMDAAVEWATRALEGQPRWSTSLSESLQLVEGRALRALALASLGRADEALADTKTVESSPVLGPSALARASLARAVILARSGRAAELEAHYAAEGEALVEELVPRERALSRALRRMGQPRARSVYREAATLEEPADEEARDWVRRIAPEAARFVPSTAHGPVVSDAAPGPHHEIERLAAAAAAAPARASTWTRLRAGGRSAVRSTAGKVVALWLVLIALFVALWNFLQPDPHRSRHVHVEATPGPSPTESAVVMGVILVVTVSAIVWSRRRRYRQQLQRIQRAQLALARGDDPQAMADLNEVALKGGPALGPPAYLVLAREAMRRGDTDGALRACADGLRLATSTLVAKEAHHHILVPELGAMRAFALAAAGRLSEARAELATLEREHPGFAYRARAIFRVELLDAVKRGDLAAASRVVAAREPEMSVELRVDLLGEVACAAAVGGLPDEAAEALRSELSAMPRVASWIETVAPGLCARIGRAHTVRVATPYVSRSDALREEDTVRLDEEAAQLIALGARRPRS